MVESLHNAEVKIERQLHNGSDIKAAGMLLDEFDKNPQLAMQLVKSESIRAQYANDKFHVGVTKSGDVMIFNADETNGIYAGHMPSEIAAQPAPQSLPPLKEVYVAPRPEPVPLQETAPPPPAETATYPPAYGSRQDSGVHIPFPIDIGVESGELHIGVNILGLGKGGVEFGDHNGAYVGSDVLRTEFHGDLDLNSQHVGPSGTWKVLDGHVTAGRVQAGFTPNSDGVGLGGRVDAEAFDGAINAGGGGAMQVGRVFGPQADVYGQVGPLDAGANAHADLSNRGLQAGVDGNAEAQHVINVQAKGRAGLGAANQAYGDAGFTFFDQGRLSAGAGIYPQFSPDVYARVGDGSLGIGANPAQAIRTAPNYEFVQD